MKYFAVLLCFLLPLAAPGQSPKSFVGTVIGFRPERAEVEVKPDSGEAVVAQLTSETLSQKIAPGERDLKNVQPLPVTEVAKGDRVLVTLEPDSKRVRRIVVMSATEIAGRNDLDRKDWQKRGVSGVVAAKNGNELILRNKTLTGAETTISVVVTNSTSIKRYAPDSVKFSNARPAAAADIRPGDQVRARGEKNADGTRVVAADVVFGTFVLAAGTIAAVEPEAGQIKVKELVGNKLLTVKLTADSQIKQMMAIPAMGGGRVPAGAPAGGPPGGAPPAFDVNQMVDNLPLAKLEDLKPGATVVISSTKPAAGDQLTAILLLTNADMLIQMASAMGASQGNPNGGLDMGGLSDLSSLMGLGMGGINQ